MPTNRWSGLTKGELLRLLANANVEFECVRSKVRSRMTFVVIEEMIHVLRANARGAAGFWRARDIVPFV